MKARGPLAGVGAVALSSLFFACQALVARRYSRDLSPGQLMCARFGLMALVVAMWHLRKGTRPAIPRPGLWAARGLVGGLAVFLYFFSIERTGAGVATLLNYTSPAFAAPFAAWFLAERVEPRVLAGMATAVLGMLLVTAGTLQVAQGGQVLLGLLAGVCSSVLSGAALTMVRSLRKDTSTLTVIFGFSVLGLLWGLPLAAMDFRPLTAGLAAAALGIAALALVAQLLLTWGFGHTSAARGSATLLLTPAASWLLAWVFLDEPASWLGVAGAVCCLLGVLWASGVPSWRPAPSAPPQA